MASVSFRHVYKRFGDVSVIKDFNLEIADKEFMVFVGPSGCGKSTNLRMLAGLEEVTEGEILIGDRVVNDVPPKDRDIAMVFQSYALYPHMSVYDNMAFGLKLRKMPKEEIDRRVKEAAEIMGLSNLLDRKPKALSGGQRQRVAVCRAIVREPSVFLMDEPLSNLDAKLRVTARAEISKLHKRLGTTFIYVTHDQVEAMTMGQRIAVMKDGVLQQCDEPETVYNRPANKFVAGFIGAPPMNFVDAHVEETPQGLFIEAKDFRLPLPADHAAKTHAGRPVTLGIRPEAIFDAAMNNPIPSTAANTIEAKVDVLEPLGPEYTAYLFTGNHNILATIDSGTQIKEGSTCRFAINLDALHLFDVESEQAIR